jgi:hypothetical protein
VEQNNSSSTVIVNGDTDFMDSVKGMFSGNQAAD